VYTKRYVENIKDMYVTLNSVAPDVFEFDKTVFNPDFSKSCRHTVCTVSDAKAAEVGGQYSQLQVAAGYCRRKIGLFLLSANCSVILLCLCWYMFQIHSFCSRFSVMLFMFAAQGRGLPI
jgi:hypothetical protein